VKAEVTLHLLPEYTERSNPVPRGINQDITCGHQCVKNTCGLEGKHI